jgi:hypothetical protein
MAYTYPPVAATLSPDLTAAQVHYLLKSPALLARRIRDLSLYKYIADYLLPAKYVAMGGAILYPSGEPVFANDDPEAVGILGEYPLTTLDAGTLALAKTVKWGRDVEVSDESISRMLTDPLNRALSRLVNSNVKYVDSVALGVIASKITNTKAAGAAWTGANAGIQAITDVLATKAQVEELEDGFTLDTVVLKPTQWAKVMSALIAANVLPRESDVIRTGDFPNALGLTWTASVHSPVTDPLLVDRNQLGGMADENIQSPGYAGGTGGVEVKSIRKDEVDGYRVRARRVTVPLVLEPNAGVRITGTGI